MNWPTYDRSQPLAKNLLSLAEIRGNDNLANGLLNKLNIKIIIIVYLKIISQIKKRTIRVHSSLACYVMKMFFYIRRIMVPFFYVYIIIRNYVRVQKFNNDKGIIVFFFKKKKTHELLFYLEQFYTQQLYRIPNFFSTPGRKKQ